MINHKLCSILFCFVLLSATFSQNLFIDSTYGYQTLLPENWIWESENKLSVTFRDTTQKNGTLLGVTLVGIEGSQSEEWTRSAFIAYKADIDSAIQFLATILYYDSSQTTQMDGQWAPEVFATYFEDNYWMEYVSFATVNGNGYEFFALGDTTDMKENVSTYSAILRSTTFFPPREIVPTKPHRKRRNWGKRYRLWDIRQPNSAVDLKGRILKIPHELTEAGKIHFKRRGQILLNRKDKR